MSHPAGNNGCPQWESSLNLSIDGALDPGMTSRLNEHLRGCAGCRRLKRDLLFMRQLSQGMSAPQLSQDLVPLVKESLFDGRQEQERPERFTGNRRRRPWKAAAVHAAMVLLGFFFAFAAYEAGRADAGADGNTSMTAESTSRSRLDRTAPPAPDHEDDGFESTPSEFLDVDDSESDVPVEDVVLSRKARHVLESCDAMAEVKAAVAREMPTVAGGALHVDPLVMDIAEATFDLERLIRDGTFVPLKDQDGHDLGIAFEICGEGVHLRIDVRGLEAGVPQVRVIDLKHDEADAARKPALKRLKIR